MKIQLNSNISEFFKNFLSTFKREKKEAELINFENRTRKGAECVLEENKEVKVEEKQTKRKATQAFSGMCMLLILTLTLNFRFRDYLNVRSLEVIPDEPAIAVSSSVESDESAPIVKVEEKKEEKLIFIPALEGEIQKMYSIDKVIYSKTLGQWKTHDGIDVAPSGSNVVKAIERGVVDSVYKDPFYGTTIKIEHINGYMSVYSNLEEDVYVKAGQSVIKGQKIGKVGNTAIGEALDNPHLHFMLYFNNNIVNPTYIFK